MNSRISSGRLTIVVDPNEVNQVRMLLNNQVMELYELEQEGKSAGKINAKVYESEMSRLLNLAENIMSNTRIFEYLPLTKDGNFPKNRNILIADTKCIDVTDYGGGCIGRKKLQLRLIPYYATTNDFVHNIKAENIMQLHIDMYSVSSKQQPIIDDKGLPHRVDLKPKNKYLSDASIIPGRVYTEPSGTEYLYLGRLCIHIVSRVLSNNNTFSRGGAKCHFYIRMTNKLKDKLKVIDSMNKLYYTLADMYNVDIDSDWLSKCSVRDNPRKFVAESYTLIPNPAIEKSSFTVQFDGDWVCQYNIEEVK